MLYLIAFIFEKGFFHSIIIWDTLKGEKIKTLSNHTGSVNCLAVLSDYKLASGSSDKTIKIWDTISGQLLETLSNHTGSVETLAALPDNRLASGSFDKTIKTYF